MISYSGELASTNPTSWVSLVDHTLGNGQPCMYPQIASVAAADASHTVATQASASTVTFSNLNTLSKLDGAALRVYAVCYATGDGSNTDTTWADSYVRYSLTDLESLQHHSAIHTTFGMIPNEDDIELAWDGELPFTGANIVLVKEQESAHDVQNANGFYRYDPCDNTRVSAGADTCTDGGPCATNHVKGLTSLTAKRVTFTQHQMLRMDQLALPMVFILV